MPIKLTQDQFIEKSKLVHGEKFNYSLVNYVDCKTKVKIICKEHGEFEQTPDSHLYNRRGCILCSNRSKDINIFIKKAKLIHGNKYDYSLVKYNNCKQKVIIVCKIHGEFTQIPDAHINLKQGCPICKSSKGELAIKQILDTKNIKYIQQFKFNDCRSKQPLPFDFYLPEHNICIEFDGEQHFRPYRYSNNQEKNELKFKQTQTNDKIKDEYCHDNNIHLIRIPYTDCIIDRMHSIQELV